MSTQGLAAIGWKELRQVQPILGMTGAGLAAAMVVSSALLPTAVEVIVACVLPLLGALFGAASVAGERADGTLEHLVARPARLGAVLVVKAFVHLSAAAVSVLVVVIFAALLPDGLEQWSFLFDCPPVYTWAVGALLTFTFFFASFAVALHLRDVLVSMAAGALVGAAWTLIVLTPGLLLAASLEDVFGAWPLLVPALVGVPIISAWASHRWLRLAPIPAVGSRARWSLSVAAGVIVVAGGLSLIEPARARTAMNGKALPQDGSVHLHSTAGAVAFVVRPGRGAPRTVITYLEAREHDDRRTRQQRVLPAGTSPLGWLRRTGGLLVRWPDGRVRSVPASAGRRTSPATDISQLITDEGEMRVEGERVVGEWRGRSVIAYPSGGAS